MDGDAVGRVLGNTDEGATPLSFWCAVEPDRWLQLDDVVVTERPLPEGVVTLSGVVAQVRARQEGARYDSDVFLVDDGVLPAETVEAAEVMVTRVDPETYVPPRPGAAVRRAEGAERDHALYFDQMDTTVPVGIGRDGLALHANLEFLDGTRGAHVNISGISGVATKTSYATFLLYGLFNGGALGPEAINTKALIFNVKGEDLLFLDRPNARLTTDQRHRYAALGLEPGPFRSVATYAPPRAGDGSGAPDVSAQVTGASTYWWTLAELCAEELLPFVFADVEDDRQQYTMVVGTVTARLKHEHEPVGEDGAVRIEGRTLRTYDELVELIDDCVSDESDPWNVRVPLGTVNAFLRRLRSSVKPLARLIRADLTTRSRHSVDATTEPAQVTVVDLHNLPDRAKRFVVGVTIRRTFESKERQGQRRPLLFLVLDELNKYAPRDGSSPIKEILLDVAERGRSLGVILIGAQQTASEVERRVIANSALRVVGRLDPAEASRTEYGFLPPTHRQRATLAKPGTMFVSQPEIPVPLVAEFPFPAWATRAEEVAGAGAGPSGPGGAEGDGRDPFSGLS